MALKPAPLVERVAVTRHYDVLLLKIHPFIYGYDNLQQGYDITKIDFLPSMSEIIPLGTSIRITVIAKTLITNDRFVRVAP